MSYNAETIKSLDYFEHIRKYPGMYVGSKDIKGLHHCIKEIISNSIDEYLNGAGDTITIKILKDGGIYVKDNARGIPHGKHETGCSLLQACFGIANTGGKFDNATGRSGYNSSGGEHGTGGKAVNALSTKMIVSTARDGKKEIIEFSKGSFVSSKEEKSEEHGVEVLFYPDAEVFETVDVDINALKELVRELSFLDKGLTFILEDERVGYKETFLSNNGLSDYINYLGKNKDFIANPLYINEKEGQFQVEIAIGYTSNYSSTIKLYTNNIPQEKGTHLTGFKTAWTSSLNTFARNKKWLKEKDSNLTGSDFEEGQILIINFKMIDPVFKGQNKEELSSSEGRTYVQRLTSKALDILFKTNEKEIKLIFDKAASAKKAREAAKKAKEKIRENDKKKSKLLISPKLADCNNANRKECELFVVEGDSAAGNMKSARNKKTQAIFPVRGKIRNCQKATAKQILDNLEITTLISAIGLSFNPTTLKCDWDEKKLRYGKIIIAADGDSDGRHIKNLFYTCLWNICPELFEFGYVYALYPPLFVIKKGKDERIFLQDEKALTEYKKNHPNEKYTLSRNKGLGEQDEDETEEVLLNPDNRVLKKVIIKDKGKTQQMFSDLMGTKPLPRKEFIQKKSKEAKYFE